MLGPEHAGELLVKLSVLVSLVGWLPAGVLPVPVAPGQHGLLAPLAWVGALNRPTLCCTFPLAPSPPAAVQALH